VAPGTAAQFKVKLESARLAVAAAGADSGVIAVALEATETPTAFLARIFRLYCWPAVSEPTVNDRLAEPVDTQVPEPSSSYSISVIAALFAAPSVAVIVAAVELLSEVRLMLGAAGAAAIIA
jgi:hypothetical protein